MTRLWGVEENRLEKVKREVKERPFYAPLGRKKTRSRLSGRSSCVEKIWWVLGIGLRFLRRTKAKSRTRLPPRETQRIAAQEARAEYLQEKTKSPRFSSPVRGSKTCFPSQILTADRTVGKSNHIRSLRPRFLCRRRGRTCPPPTTSASNSTTPITMAIPPTKVRKTPAPTTGLEIEIGCHRPRDSDRRCELLGDILF